MLSVIVTTYEWPGALDAVLRGLASQSDPDFEIVVADDGSGPATKDVVSQWRGRLGDRLLHVWQPDEGFRLARVRNLGAESASGDAVVFIDGDCIPRNNFVRAIKRALLPGWFLASTRLQLSRSMSEAVLTRGIRVEGWARFRLVARARRGIDGLRHLTPRDRRRSWRPRLPDFAPPGNEYGFCTAIARADFEAVNGVDMRFVGWGDQDVDLAVRLKRSGVRCGYAGPDSAMLHLWHASNIPTDRPTWWLLKETEQSTRIAALEGLRELRCETA